MMWIHCPLSTSHTRKVASSLPLSRLRLSGMKAIAYTPAVCPCAPVASAVDGGTRVPVVQHGVKGGAAVLSPQLVISGITKPAESAAVGVNGCSDHDSVGLRRPLQVVEGLCVGFRYASSLL